jgi:hypothetical protein
MCKSSGTAGRETTTDTWQSSRQEMKEKKLQINLSKHMRYELNSISYISVQLLLEWKLVTTVRGLEIFKEYFECNKGWSMCTFPSFLDKISEL